jgi:two-component system response regulator PilR (NtrC family)
MSFTAPPPALPNATGPSRILVVDDEPDLRTLYELTLLREGHLVDAAGTLAEAREQLAHQRYDLLITDMRLPDGLGLDLLRDGTAAARASRTVVVTAYGSAESAVEALKQGAFDYLTKPVDLKQFRTVVATALQSPAPAMDAALASRASRAAQPTSTASTTIGGASAALPSVPALDRLIGSSAAMQLVKDRIARVAGSMAPVMILGESGTGKEVVARAIHGCSHRATGPFIAVNCGAIPDSLLEAEFFGARKGAYTGATTDREGYFAAARTGTLFLDEIGDLPQPMQAKLLRAIQERKIRPLGGVQEEAVDVRILCATHKDLAKAVADGQFRQDLFYRLNVIELRLPALRDRREDLDALVDGLMQRICHDTGQPPAHLSPEARAWLHTHPLDGNVRELENLLHRALALCSGDTIVPADLRDDHPPSGQMDWMSLPEAPAPAPARPPQPPTDAPVTQPPAVTLPPEELPSDLQQYLDAHEKRVLERMLRETKGNRTAAAARLGLNLRQIRYRIARLGIQVKDPDDAPAADAPES